MNAFLDFSQRRGFLKACGAATSTLVMPELNFLRHLPRVSAAEATLPENAVRFSDDIEPLVRLIEETDRSRTVEEVARKIQEGTSYQEVLTALLLAGVRNVQPRPSVGFKFHAVLVVNSAHLASLASPDHQRWLPIFWAIDYFKSAQKQDEREGEWTMSAVDESKLPPPHRAVRMFRDAMETWDEEAADVAVASMSRSVGMNEIFELMAYYGCRDFRSIGHKAIYVANGFRTLQVIGSQYAEPVLRSLTYALLNHNGEPNPSKSDLAADAAVRVTDEVIADIPMNWMSGKLDSEATMSLLDTMRTAEPVEAVRETAAMLSRGVAPQSLCDAMFLSAAEMVSQQPAIVPLHAATSTNALQYAYRTAVNDQTRLRLLLQNAAFIAHFRDAMIERDQVADRRIDELLDVAAEASNVELPEVFATMKNDRSAAARQAAGYLRKSGNAESLMHSARELVFLKGNDSHDYKYSSAVLEDYYQIQPQYRDSYLAAATYLLPSAADRDNGLVQRVQSALG